MTLAALLKKLEQALGRGRGAMKTATRRTFGKSASSKKTKLNSKDIARIKRESDRSAAAYTAEWKRKNPELARRFSK